MGLERTTPGMYYAKNLQSLPSLNRQRRYYTSMYKYQYIMCIVELYSNAELQPTVQL